MEQLGVAGVGLTEVGGRGGFGLSLLRQDTLQAVAALGVALVISAWTTVAEVHQKN